MNNSLLALSHLLSPQLTVRYEAENRALWIRWKPTPRPCFNMTLLRDLATFAEFIEQSHGLILDEENRSQPINYLVYASDIPKVFCYGGDLEFFAHAVTQRSEQNLRQYADLCVDLVYRYYHHFWLDVTTIALVQGDCLGGGFEMALASDWIIAEEQATFGFPEVRQGFPPGMGASSILERCLSRSQADKLLSGTENGTAKEMEALGLVREVVEQGQGKEGVCQFIKRHSRHRNGSVAIAQARRRVQQITRVELEDIVKIWRQAVMRLTDRDVKRLLRTTRRQEEKGE